MNISAAIKELKLGESIHFAMKRHKSILSICTRLKRNNLGTFKTIQNNDRISVTRTQNPSTGKEQPSAAVKKLQSVGNDLAWAVEQFDPVTQVIEVWVIITTEGKSHRLRISPGDDFPVLAQHLITYINSRT